MPDIQSRKMQHITLAQQAESQMEQGPFAHYQLPYKALPEIDLDQVKTDTSLLGKTISQPLIIASMTGGEAHAKTINKHLALAAEELQVAFGVGSQRIAIEKPEARESFEQVRKFAPNAVIFANMGAVQLNYSYTVEHYKRVVDMIEADGLYLHLNPLQEAIQPEGDTNFLGLKEKIAHLVDEIGVPVFVKEVGHGLDAETCLFLDSIGVAGIDIAGTGGTSWSWIEAQRRESPQLAEWFKEYGLSTDVVLQDLKGEKLSSVLVASGGIRSPIQGVIAHMLGATYYSAARPFLDAALESDRAVMSLLSTWQKGLQVALFTMGMKTWQEASSLDPVLIR